MRGKLRNRKSILKQIAKLFKNNEIITQTMVINNNKKQLGNYVTSPQIEECGRRLNC